MELPACKHFNAVNGISHYLETAGLAWAVVLNKVSSGHMMSLYG